MRVRYHGPHDGVRIPMPRGRDVVATHGETIEVDDALGVELLKQPDNWEKVADPPPNPPPAKAEKKED